MERQKHIIASYIFVLVAFSPANDFFKKDIYQAYIGNNMNLWQMVIDKMEQEKKMEKDYLFQLVNYQYGYIGWCLGNDKNDKAKAYLEKAEKNLELLEKENADPSLIHAYKSAFFGFKIGLSRIRAPIYGPRSIKHAKQAIELNRNNPMGYIQYGNSQFYMPSMFGGSKEEAISYFQKAEQLMEQQPEALENNWNYLSLLTLIAQSFEEMGQHDKAENYYKKVLRVEPDFSWVKNELYPAFLKKHRK